MSAVHHSLMRSAQPAPSTRAGSSNGVRKSVPLQQQTGCCNSLQAGASQWSMQTSPSTEEGSPPSQPLSSKHPVPEHGPARPHQHSSKLVPIKNLTFLPPIKPPQHHPRLCEHLCGSMKASDQGAVCENDGFLASGTRWGPECPVYPTALSSKCPTCQHSLSLFSTMSLSDPKRPQGPVSSKRDTAHCSSFSMGRSPAPALRSTAAVGAHGPGCLFS
ncbi:uncharacterized protein LOC114852033 [Betta splendens]|uniref:Uncharacterized protein LOC114852033 n=1 Tax=Betta splendens TaxID=158456 RepID=A0A6P7M112_BETSP|nr:uncharacterized protein LOC114852033 [Betta splendens]